MKDLTVIIPVLELGEEDKKLFDRAYKSVVNNGSDTKIIVIGPSQKMDSDINYVVNSGDTSYASQVMTAVNLVETKYFSVVEYDDEMTDIWLKNVQRYIDNDVDNTFAYLPLTEVSDYKTNEIDGYANEAVWASSFSEEIGCFDLASTESYLNFNVHGGVFKKDDFLTLGGLKQSMKIVYWYEFLLRALYKQKRIFVIPKVGYIHTVNRDGSITDNDIKNIGEKETSWWIDLASKEYFFSHDRKKKYEE